MNTTAQVANAIAAEIAFQNAAAVNPYLTNPNTAELHRAANKALRSLTRAELQAVRQAVPNA